MTAKTVANFLSKVVKTGHGDACWVWAGYTDKKEGYGHFNIQENGQHRNVLSHRYAWELARGPIPMGKKVLHSCDNPPCVRLSHLFLGTQQDNVDDMISKGRGNMSHAGPLNGNAILSELDVLEIVALLDKGKTTGEVAKRFGVLRDRVYRIDCGADWSYLTGRHK